MSRELSMEHISTAGSPQHIKPRDDAPHLRQQARPPAPPLQPLALVMRSCAQAWARERAVEQASRTHAHSFSPDRGAVVRSGNRHVEDEDAHTPLLPSIQPPPPSGLPPRAARCSPKPRAGTRAYAPAPTPAHGPGVTRASAPVGGRARSGALPLIQASAAGEGCAGLGSSWLASAAATKTAGTATNAASHGTWRATRERQRLRQKRVGHW